MPVLKRARKTTSEVQPTMGVAWFPDQPQLPKIGKTYPNHPGIHIKNAGKLCQKQYANDNTKPTTVSLWRNNIFSFSFFSILKMKTWGFKTILHGIRAMAQLPMHPLDH